jgi:hypothetical protein
VTFYNYSADIYSNTNTNAGTLIVTIPMAPALEVPRGWRVDWTWNGDQWRGRMVMDMPAAADPSARKVMVRGRA